MEDGVDKTMRQLQIMKNDLRRIMDKMPLEEGKMWQNLLKPSIKNVCRIREELTDDQILQLMELACCSFYRGLADLVFESN